MSSPVEPFLRQLPSVSQVLTSEAGRALTDRFGQGALKLELRSLLDEFRARIRRDQVPALPDLSTLTALLEHRLHRLARPEGKRAINATGILLHTGLGRAPLSDDAMAAIATGAGYSVLQASLDSGDRSLREERIQRILQELTGCQAATIVNNNAAATMLILHTLAAGKEVIISRGQLIEIGGSFRMTEVMSQSGALLREVGTTNRTHLRDYASAINENTGAIIHVHTSNYRIRGFAGAPAVEELVPLARQHHLPLIDDLGSGALVPLSEFGLADEPLVQVSLASGADIACFSGDKLICGPQAGLICGQSVWIDKIRKNPFARMFRVCKMTLAGMEATLLHFLNGDYRRKIPFYRLLARPLPLLERDARALADRLASLPDVRVHIADDLAYVGSGSLPDEGIPTKIVTLTHRTCPPNELARRLRQGIPSVFTRLKDRALVFDLRSLLEGQLEEVAAAVQAALNESPLPPTADTMAKKGSQ